MSKDEKRNREDYDVGYGRPPKEHQFKKGVSGNPAGAPPRRKRKDLDVATVLNEPVPVKKSGKRKELPPYEVAARKLVERGLNHNDLKAILEFLRLCELNGIIAPPPLDPGGGVIQAPRGVDFHEWLASVTELVPPGSEDVDGD